MTTLTELASGFSLDSLRQAGEYAIPAPTGAPVGVNHCFVTVKSHSLAGVRRVTQMLYDAETGGGHYRAFGSSGWTAWAEVGAGGGSGSGGITRTDGAPDDGDGEDEDVRIDPATGDVYEKIGGSWSAQGNMFTAQDDAFWTQTIKGANTTRQSTDVLADDPDLWFQAEANRLYLFRFYVWYESGGTPDFKFAITGPASIDKLTAKRMYLTPNGSAYSGIGEYGAFASLGTNINQTGGTRGFVELDGILENGPNAGPVTFRWAQNTSTASDTTVLRGSYVEFKDRLDV
jgi:hypothetical protein